MTSQIEPKFLKQLKNINFTTTTITPNVKHEMFVLLPFRQMFIGTSTYNLQHMVG